MRVYDEVDAHRAELPGDVPRKAGGTHIGIFLAWCVERELTSDWHHEQQDVEYARLQRRWYTGRDYLIQFMDGRLTEEHLSPAGRAFAEWYYATGRYRADYERVLRHHHPTIYHVPDKWESLDEIAPVIDQGFDAWRAERRRERASEREEEEAPVAAPVREVSTSEPAPQPEPQRASFEPVSDPVPDPAPEPRAPTAPVVVPSVPPPPPRFEPVPEPDPEPEPEHEPVPPPAPRTAPPLLDAPHRTKKAWRRKRSKGGSWTVALVIFALLYGCSQLNESRRKRTKRNLDRQREAFERSMRRRILKGRNVERPVPRRPFSVQQRDAASRQGLPVSIQNAQGMRLALIPPGGFVMGSPMGEAGRGEDETPHNVVITKPFYMSITEVTNAQYRRFRKSHLGQVPSGLSGHLAASAPVTSVSWDGANAYCAWLTKQDGRHTYRLPTEAEWEYACRAGSSGPFPWQGGRAAATLYANVADSAARTEWPRRIRASAEKREDWSWFPGSDRRAGLSAVARYRANPWGLYDMIGNAAEWCADWAGPYDESVVQNPSGPGGGRHRIHRGGAFDTPVRETRSAFRGREQPYRYEPNLGFRVVAEPR
ncbi:MAG: SUMF1/EgtB/PvdO family nonheme iron enzyme [Planctomycetota bacterium]|nr:SUMF1/EgtB/PvdO family nonheme iron enzyme [Planctomycetota bacterium]